MLFQIVLLALVVLAGTSVQAAEPGVTLTVHADKPAHKISPHLYGIFFEDINYGADGGMYAELVQNRSFEFKGVDALFAWSKIERGGTVNISVETNTPLNASNLHFLRLQIQSVGKGAGVANSGFAGIAAKRGEKYLFSVHARAVGGFRGGLTARLESADGKLLGSCRVGRLSNDWKKLTGAIVSSVTDTNAQLLVLATGTGTVDLDVVSLFPENTWKKRPNGLRADLVQMLADMKPSFVRFPGGCIVEGKDLANRYVWKDTIGDIAGRKTNWNRWQDAVRIKAPQYYQSYGLGFFEFFQLCEDIGAEPLPVINCGMSCQYQDKQVVPLDQLDPFVQDALDLIEFATGPASSPWGAKRAAMRHPAPFHLKFLAIGNEQWGETYFERYPRFHAAIKAKYPEIQLVSSAGPSPDGQWFDYAWPRLKEIPADLVDEHYYKPPQWFFDNTHRYDNYDRKGPKVFAGEYAAHNRNRRNNLEAALAEAAFMTGLERNSDIVTLASYAPLFAKIGSTQWYPDLIWFDNTKVYGSPSYYVQKLFSLNRGDVVLPTELSATNLFVAASRDIRTGEVILKVVNPTAEATEMSIKLEGVARVSPTAEATILASAKPSDENSLSEPTKVSPVTTPVKGVAREFRQTFKPYSLTILRLSVVRQ
jgi:alpha-L-arabinofuranosidase